jgi:dTDP-4-dehydrorhamnose 3,5-epimerase
MFLIPVGFAHGYAVLSDEAEALYKCSNVYDPELEDEILWNDPDIAVDWPIKDPNLSERDLNAQTFKQYLEGR